MVEMEVVVVISEEEEEQQLDLEMMMLENDDNLMETRLQTQTKSGLIELESLKFLRVLLVEFDDSTRSIIAALLRKSGYRVVAVADGLKAWETLQDRSHNIDLVLAEVQLPSPLSGFSLLSKIMGDDLCRNIPVIMMSSYDAVNVVFKCMLGGAADFLVKPVRKNELRNLWQHVWRRNSATSAEKSPSIPIRNPSQQKTQSFEEISSTKQQHSILPVAPPNQRGSDAHSSCGKPDPEDDNMDMEAMHNLSQLKSRNVSSKKSTKRLKEGKSVNLDDAEDKSVRLASEVAPCSQISHSIELVSDEQHANAGTVTRGKGSAPVREHSNVHTDNYYTQDEQLKPSREAMDLIGSFDNQLHESNTPYEEVLPDTRDKNCSSTPRLELSLKRSHFSDSDIQGAETRTLKHSNASAFSWYHQQPAHPPVCSESQEDVSISCKHALSHTAEAPRQGVISVSLPVRSTRVDGLYSGYGGVCPQLLYAPVDPLPLQNVPRQEAVCHVYSSDHNDGQSNCKSTNNTTMYKQQSSSVECLGESKHVSMAAQSVNSSLCNSSSSNRNSSGCGSVCDGSNGNETNAAASAGRGNDIGVHCSTQREAALTKFRLKRKDRCFDKKVRYQSRKRLAEQRPRVKGQFVRQISS